MLTGRETFPSESKKPVNEIHHLLSSSKEVKEWVAVYVHSPICIHGAHGYNVTFTLHFVIKYPILKIKKKRISDDFSCTTQAAFRLFAS